MRNLRRPGRLATAGALLVLSIAAAAAAASLGGRTATELTFGAAARGEPLVIAHRGASGYRPEHTHYTLPPWAWDPADTDGLLSASEVAAALGVHEPDWRIVLAEELPRTVTRRDGHPSTVLDAVLHAVRLTAPQLPRSSLMPRTQLRSNAASGEAFAEHDRIDVVVSNAGYGVAGTAEDLDGEQVEAVIATNPPVPSSLPALRTRRLTKTFHARHTESEA